MKTEPLLCDNPASFLARSAEEGQAAERLLFRQALLTDLDLTELAFREVVFDSCRFAGTVLTRASFEDALFKNCDLSGCNLTDSHFTRCEFHGCKGVGTEFGGSGFAHVLIRGGQYELAGLGESRFEKCEVASAALPESIWSQCRFKSLRFTDTDLTRASFFKTPLEGLDLSTCRIEGFVVSTEAEELRGVTVSALQAVELAKLLGIHIKD